MNKLTATAVALAMLALFAVSQREHAEYRRHVAGWEKSANPPYTPPFVPGQCKGFHPQMPVVTVPIYPDELP